MISKEERQKLIEEYATRNGGTYDPKGFMLEVAEQGLNHPAHAWFQWDDTAAAEAHRVEQARRFAQGLRVVFEVQKVGGGVVSVKVPASHSPLAGRLSGGGYRVTDPGSPEHLTELRKQAFRDLQSWQKRYAVVLADCQIECQELLSALSAPTSKAA